MSLGLPQEKLPIAVGSDENREWHEVSVGDVVPKLEAAVSRTTQFVERHGGNLVRRPDAHYAGNVGRRDQIVPGSEQSPRFEPAGRRIAPYDRTERSVVRAQLRGWEDVG